MSRSVKGSPFCNEAWSSRSAIRWHKNQANRKVRRYKGEVPNGGWFKRLYCSWLIHDFHWFCPESEWPKWGTHQRWCKLFRRK